MTELKTSRGITYALANYAKELNEGKEIKFTKKQWQSIMQKVVEMNNKRQSWNKIFTGGTNLYGHSGKNFVVHSNIINFTEEELQIILSAMGLGKIKGLSVERRVSENSQYDNTADIGESLTRPLPVLEIKLQNQPGLNLFKSQSIPLMPEVKIKIAAETLNYTPKPAKGGTETNPAELPQSLKPLEQLPLTETAEILMPASSDDTPVLNSVKKTENIENLTLTPLSVPPSPRALAKRNGESVDNRPFDNISPDLIIKDRKEFNIKDLLEKFPKISDLGDDKRTIEILNKKGEVIAKMLPDGMFILKDKVVSEEEFNKYAAKKGKRAVITIEKINLALIGTPNIRLNKNFQVEMPETAPIMNKENIPFPVNGNPVEVPDNQIKQIVSYTAQKYGIDEELILAVIKKESGFKNTAKSAAGAMGLMQLMPKTAAGYGVKNPWDPAQNIDAGARVLKTLLKQYNGDVMLALAGYNYGVGNVNKKLRGKPMDISAIYENLPKETREYVQKVYSDYVASKQQFV